MKKHILIAGYYGFRNCGDEAILHSLLADLRRAEPDLSVCVLSGDPEATRRLYNVEAIPIGDIDGIIEQARRSDGLIVGGGGIFQDYWGAQKKTLLTRDQAGLPFYSSLPLLGWLLEKPVLLYAVGAGPLFSQEAKELTRLSFELATFATVRDHQTLELIGSLGSPTQKVQVTADPAFTLQPDARRAKEILEGFPIDPKRPTVGVCLRNWDIGIDQSAWQTELVTALDEFADRTGCMYLFLPFHDLPGSILTQDALAAEGVIQQMSHQQDCVLVQAQEDPTVMAGIFPTCDLIVGMRYHSIVFSAIAGVPAVGLAYDAKVMYLMQSLGLAENVLPLSDLSSSALLSCLTRTWKNRTHYREQLDGRVSELKKSTDGNFTAIQKLLASESVRRLPNQKVDQFIRKFSLEQSLSLEEKEKRIENLEGEVSKRELTTREMAARIQEKDQALQAFTTRIVDQNKQIESLGRQLSQVKQSATKISIQLSVTESHLRESLAKTDALEQGRLFLENQLNNITRSRGWKLLIFLWELRKGIVPPGSRLEWALKSIWRWLHGSSPRRFGGRIFQPPYPFNDRYIEEDNSQVTVYTDDPLLYSNYPSRAPLKNDIPDRLQVSLIATVKNEASNVGKWMACIQQQTRRPNEIVILDGGSIDGTDQQIQEWSERCPIPVRLIRAPGTNIARGRNSAIQEARYPIIAITDFGCEQKPDWLEKLIQPFKIEPETRVSAGFYESINQTGEVMSGNGLWPGQVDPQSFLPSSRSVAFRKEALEAVGNHPEWLTRDGDDTYLDLELKRLGGKWAFVPDAKVLWVVPDRLGDYLKKMYQWATGDGESGVHARYYWRYLLNWFAWISYSLALLAVVVLLAVKYPSWLGLWMGIGVILWLLPALLVIVKEKVSPVLFIYGFLSQGAHVLGFLKGASRIRDVERRRREIAKGWFFILSGVPIDDTGGGVRGTQIALELLRQGYGIVFVHKFPKDESRFLDLRYLHPNLYQFSRQDFSLSDFAKEHPEILENPFVAVLMEFPLPDFLLIARELRDRYHARVAYDLLDDWQTTLGGTWYTPAMEKEIIDSSQLLVATLPLLARRLESTSGRECILLPNAVNPRLFDPQVKHPLPADLPVDQRILIYVGALWGEWLDWDLIRQTALHHPEDALVLIGDYRGQCPQPPKNLHFLGLKPQASLPAYLAHADVALIPWRVGPITQATDPIKVYEYLAMQLPVLAPRLEPLITIPGVVIAKDSKDFIQLAGSLSKETFDRKSAADFVSRNTWQERVRVLLEALEKIPPGK